MADDQIDLVKTALLEAILPHVAFDGWSDTAFQAAQNDSQIEADAARAACPRGAVDLAMAYHRDGDDRMVAALDAMDQSEMRIRDKIAAAIQLRLDAAEDKEAVRRGTALFAMPHLAGEGAQMIWGTADAIWNALGDQSDDVNWYSKRATLGAVYSSVVLYWLGDDSLDGQATTAFIERRIDNVMQFEKLKGQLRSNPVLKPFLSPLNRVLGRVKAPGHKAQNVPGRWAPNE